MAWGLGELEGLICPVMDARRSQVYNALFRASGGTPHPTSEDRAISMTDLEADLQSLAEPVTLVGDGALLCSGSMALPAGRLLLAPGAPAAAAGLRCGSRGLGGHAAG